MKTHTHYGRVGRSALAALMMALFFMFVGQPGLRADDDRTKCQRDTEKAETRLDDAIQAHGEHSHEAADRMNDLRKQRERCYDRFHEWWDGREQRWHDDRDFDHDLHDHDHDH